MHSRSWVYCIVSYHILWYGRGSCYSCGFVSEISLPNWLVIKINRELVVIHVHGIFNYEQKSIITNNNEPPQHHHVQLYWCGLAAVRLQMAQVEPRSFSLLRGAHMGQEVWLHAYVLRIQLHMYGGQEEACSGDRLCMHWWQNGPGDSEDVEFAIWLTVSLLLQHDCNSLPMTI